MMCAYEDNAEEKAETEPAYKTCSACRKEKPSSDFVKSKAYYDGFRPHCKECTKKGKNQRWIGKGAVTKERYPGAEEFKPVISVDI